MDADSSHRFEIFAAASRKAGAYGLMRCSSGNLSWRVGDDRMLISESRSWMADLTPDQVVECRISDCEALNDRRPSVETGFHAGILRQRPDVDVVLHFQTPCATALACHDLKGVDFNVVPEIPYYIGAIGIVPYRMPGSEALARDVVAAIAGHDLALLRNHGQVTVGKDFNDAIQKAVFFELACGIILQNRDRLIPLPGEAVERLSGATSGKEEAHA